MTDIVAELRRLYEAAIQHASDLDETASVLALNIAVVYHLPALLDVVDEARNVRLYHSDPGMLKAMLYRLGETLAALERRDEG